MLPIAAILLTIFGCTPDPEKIIGIKIYEYDGDFIELAERWNIMGINTAFVSKELAANPVFRQVLKDYEIQTFIIFPVFYDPKVLKNDSSLYAITDKGKIAQESWVEFVCPSRQDYRSLKIKEAANLVGELRPDGIGVDFIRHFVFWEMIYPDRNAESIDLACFCDSCIAGFCKRNEIILPDSCVMTEQKAAYILNGYAEEWNNFRTDLIASMVKELTDTLRGINAGLKTVVHAVPWRDSDFGGANIRVAGQDVKKMASFADYISPMCYSQMLMRDAAWIESVVKEFDSKSPDKILPSIQVYPAYIDDSFTVEDFRKCVDAAVREPSQGVIFFSWPLFEKDEERMNAVRF